MSPATKILLASSVSSLGPTQLRKCKTNQQQQQKKRSDEERNKNKTYFINCFN